MTPHRCTTVLAAVVLCFSVASVFAESAKSIVKRDLASIGVSVGFDRDRNRHVAIGVAESDVAGSTLPAHLLSVREGLYKRALFRAKQSVLEEVAADMTADDGISDRFNADESSEMVSRSAMLMQAGGLYCGFLPLASAESLEKGRYQVAIAVGWSEKSERDAQRSLSSNALVPEDEELPSPAWKEWASDKDFAFIVGGWPFVDSAGIRRFVGVGVVDAEGKSGTSMVAAMRLARSKATQALAYALYGDIESSKLAEQLGVRREDADGDAVELTIESFVNRISQAVKNKAFRDTEVYTTTVVHPVTGRKLFVSVAGIEPRDLAEMNLLGEAAGGGASRSAEPPSRPDHSVRPERPDRPDHSDRPASNRPDHSVRPASARPEHPNRRRRSIEDDGDDGNDADF